MGVMGLLGLLFLLGAVVAGGWPIVFLIALGGYVLWKIFSSDWWQRLNYEPPMPVWRIGDEDDRLRMEFDVTLELIDDEEEHEDEDERRGQGMDRS